MPVLCRPVRTIRFSIPSSRNGTITSNFLREFIPMKETDVIFQEVSDKILVLRLSSGDAQIVFNAANAGS